MVNGYKPLTLADALRIRHEFEVTPYAGGTDLMVQNKPGQTYLFLNAIPELKQIKVDEEYVRIGATVTFTEAIADEKVPKLMKEAISRIAAPAIRNAGTFGGNIGNGSAKADSVLIEFVMGAKLRLISINGERIVDIDKFYLGRKKLDIRNDELIAEILLPRTGWENYSYQKVGGRNALAISRVSFAGIIKIENDRIVNFAAAFGAVADVVLRYRDIEEQLMGKSLAEAKEMKAQITNQYAERMVLTKGRVSAEYRKNVCMKLLEDFMEKI